MGVAAVIAATLTGSYTKPAGLGNSVIDFSAHPILTRLALTLTDGTGASQANVAYLSGTYADLSVPRSIAAGANDDIDLSGTTDDALGIDTALTKVRVLAIAPDATNVNDIRVGGATNPFLGPFNDATDKINIGPGDFWVQTNRSAGWTVTPGTGDILRIHNPGGVAATYHIAIIGIG